MLKSDSFGKTDDFSIGELVRWSKLEDKRSGVIRKLKYIFEGGRNVAYADVILLGTSKTEQICCLSLEKLTKPAEKTS
jgi:hypothetical protein|tara:strand:+ start:481 stop:714 length:234 start_codon:yes stop_codon:yes gene_type:complete